MLTRVGANVDGIHKSNHKITNFLIGLTLLLMLWLNLLLLNNTLMIIEEVYPGLEYKFLFSKQGIVFFKGLISVICKSVKVKGGVSPLLIQQRGFG